MHKFCPYYTFLLINPFFFAGVHESTRVFLPRSSNCASSMHLLQYLLVCSGLFKKNPLNYTPNSGHPSIPYRNLSKLITNSFSLQLHYEAWVRFVILSLISIGIYAFYGQYHADPLSSNETIIYHRAPIEEGQ